MKIGSFPETTSHKEKGLVTIERSLGCSKTAVSVLNEMHDIGSNSLVYVHA